MNRVVLTAAVLATLLACLPAHAEDVPAHFVPEEMCASRDCTCDDIPMMEAFQANQIAGRDAWMSVKTDILTPTGPSSGPQAIALFKKRFAGDPRIIAQFKSCSGYDATKNDVSKVAGVSPLGKATVDPCFCNAFCKDIVDSTIAHERMHVPTIIAGVVGSGDMLVACKIGVVSGRVCDALEPFTLAQSELASYGAGIAYLDARLRMLQESDPMMPDVACTWEPLAQQSQEPQQAKAAPVPAPAGFFARVELLLRRIFGGESPAEAFAAFDGARR